jgi:hypothetical protein
MKFRLSAVILAGSLLLTGCSSTAQNPPDTIAEETTVPKKPEGLIYYVTDHGTTDTAQLSSLIAEATEIGYTWQEDSLLNMPSDCMVLMMNSPQEDITSEELAFLDSYLDNGGRMLMLLPPDEREIRFKYIERLLEEYCIEMDYDIITETNSQRIWNQDPEFIRIEQVEVPSRMPLGDNTANLPAFMHRARSFHMVYGDNYSAIKQDAMLETATTAVGKPFGGVQDDPVTFENEQLITMMYSRDDVRSNSVVMTVGSSDFLLDENYTAETSTVVHDWVFGAFYWLIYAYQY